MKLNFIIILILLFTLSACKKNQQDSQQDSWFHIEIKSPDNMDCRVPEIIFLDRQQEAYQIIGNSRGVYVASGLPKVLYTVGDRMYVLIQRPATNQLLVCTTQGPSYPQVHITSVK
jgi:hypothetical protein